jgi:hypothetical protein
MPNVKETKNSVILFPYSIRPLKCKLLEIKKKEKTRVKMIYEKCSVCGGRIERWEEDVADICLDCNKEF